MAGWVRLGDGMLLFRDSTTQANITSPRKESDQIREWDAFPLQSMDDIQAWLRQKSMSATVISNDSPPAANMNTFARHHPLLQATQVAPEATAGDNISESTVSPLQEAATNTELDDSWGDTIEVHKEPTMSKARDLAQKHANMYFYDAAPRPVHHCRTLCILS